MGRRDFKGRCLQIMANALNVGDAVDCVVRKIQANGLSVSLPNGRFGYVPKYCAQSLCDADGDFVVNVGDTVTLTIKELGQPVRLGDGDDAAPRQPEPKPLAEPEPEPSVATGPKVVGRIDLSQVKSRKRSGNITNYNANPQYSGAKTPTYRVGDVLEGVVSRVQDNGIYVSLNRGGQGFMPAYLMDKGPDDQPRAYRRGEHVTVGVSATKDYIRLCGEDKIRKRERREMTRPIVSTAQRYIPMMAFLADHNVGDAFLAQVADVSDDRVIISLPDKVEGVVWRNEVMWRQIDSAADILSRGDTVDAVFLGADMDHYRLLFSIRQSVPQPDDAWQMPASEVEEMKKSDPDAPSAAALYKVGDEVRVSFRNGHGYYLYFNVGSEGLQGVAFKEMFPNLTDRDGRLMAQEGDEVDAVVVYIGGRLGLCDKSIWETRRDEVEAMFLSEFVQQPAMKAVAMRHYHAGSEVTGTITDLDGERIVLALPKGGLGFLKKSEMIVMSDDADNIRLGAKLSAVVERGGRQGYTLCDRARYALQKLQVGSTLKDVYHVGDEIHGIVVDELKDGVLVSLPHGGNGLLQASHITAAAEGETPVLPEEGDEVDAVIFMIGKQKILLCDKTKWQEMQARLSRRPQDYFKPGDSFTSKVVFAARSGVYVQLPTAGKGFWPVYNMVGYEEGKAKAMPRRGATVTTIVQKVTDKGVILCDATCYARMQEKAEAKGSEPQDM